MKLKHLIITSIVFAGTAIGFATSSEFADRAVPGKSVSKSYDVYPPSQYTARFNVTIWSNDALYGRIYVGGIGQGRVCEVNASGSYSTSSGWYTAPYGWMSQCTVYHYGQVNYGSRTGYVDLRTQVSW